MARHEGFLQAIVENPDDDTPRLVYADWLDEHCEPARAEFIRVQCELARLQEWDDEWKPLSLRADELLQQHRAEWEAELRTLTAWCNGVFRRGFVEGVESRDENVLGRMDFYPGAGDPYPHLDALVRGFPVRCLTFPSPSLAAAAVHSPAVRNLHGLTIHGEHGVSARESNDQPLRLLARSPHLQNLRRLALVGVGFTAAALAELISSPQLPALEVLDLTQSPLDESKAKVLARNLRLPALRTLILVGTDMSRGGWRALAGAPWLEQLTELAAGMTDYQWDDRNARFVEAPGLRNLRKLSPGRDLTDIPLAYWAGAPAVRQLLELDLYNNYHTPHTLELLCATPLGDTAVRLDLSGGYLRTAGAAILAAPGRFTRLRWLALASNGIGDEGVQLLAAAPAMAGVTYLNLKNNFLTDAAARSLAVSPHLSRLTTLDLTYNALTARGVTEIIRSPALGRLVSLDVRNNYSGPHTDNSLSELHDLRGVDRSQFRLDTDRHEREHR
jgi:uncharacterized protein (TIGR02996 family)